MADQLQFLWERQPEAERAVVEILETFSQKNPYIAFLGHDLYQHTSTRLFDWVDHAVEIFSEELKKKLEGCGYVSDVAGPDYRVYYHPGAQLPKVVLSESGERGVALKVESIADFLMCQGRNGEVEGDLYSPYRKCEVSNDRQISLWVVERRGTTTMEPTYPEEEHLKRYMEAREKWKTRTRENGDEDLLMEQTIRLAEELVDSVGRDCAAWIVLEVERDYWQSRNTAGQMQKNRQDRMGMGWANHDHHTFRSSRRHFYQLVRLFEILGFHCRERFYAGEEAGWGAQVMENSTSGLVLFLDVDLDPHEIAIDFSHQKLPKLEKLGTIGLWCALHGDSILQSGMHHLEAQFMFEELTEEMGHRGVRMMDPFSNFSYLKQAFTAGEIWKVDPKRVQKLLETKLISKEDAERFVNYGAVGSHLENLQRREGFKGFNQKNVSYIIKKTDPRSLKDGI